MQRKSNFPFFLTLKKIEDFLRPSTGSSLVLVLGEDTFFN
jgi:hypothetical protein